MFHGHCGSTVATGVRDALGGVVVDVMGTSGLSSSLPSDMLQRSASIQATHGGSNCQATLLAQNFCLSPLESRQKTKHRHMRRRALSYTHGVLPFFRNQWHTRSSFVLFHFVGLTGRTCIFSRSISMKPANGFRAEEPW